MPDFQGMPIPGRYWSAVAIWLALTMAVLDGAIANVALPTIARELHSAPAYSVWVVNGYQLAIVVSLWDRRIHRGFGSLRAVTEPVDADFHAGDSGIGRRGSHERQRRAAAVHL